MDVVSNVELNATERIGLMEMRIQQKAHRTPSHSAQLYGTEHSPINRYIQKLLSVPSFLERCQGCRNHDTKPGNEHVWPELRGPELSQEAEIFLFWQRVTLMRCSLQGNMGAQEGFLQGTLILGTLLYANPNF